ncbi:hypothetical protein AVEN_118258-1 [Araneus ventricosus]|uniref:Uncharacterized protein n=1 Tax=Araneus ventricosus TaxID=182803 RepID=A0A4Y2DXV3_ARAVE|nr:hypothetical protein AVEN_118258-1 [Araneus ventricosus]
MRTTQSDTSISYLSSRFQNGTPNPLSRESFTSPFCGFRFCERGSLPLTHDRISVFCPKVPNLKRRRMKVQSFRPHHASSPRISALTMGFGATRSKWCGTERS